MDFGQKKSLCDALRALAPPGTDLNRAKKYPAFGIIKGNVFRIAVHVGANGASVFTENVDMLDALAAKGIFTSSVTRASRTTRRDIYFRTSQSVSSWTMKIVSKCLFAIRLK